MDDEHKAALAQGRSESRKISAYLKHLDAEKVRGPRPNPEKIEAELAELNAAIGDAPPMKRIAMIQRRLDLTDRLSKLGEPVEDGAALEAGFVEAAGGYSSRKRISYAAWREIGVPAQVLRAAGIKRS